MVVTINTFLFADLSNFTEYTWRYGDDHSAALAVGFHDLVRTLAEEAGCEFVKAIGDATMVRAADCESAVRLAHLIHDATGRHGIPPVRIGIDTGPAVPRNGDWWGTTVNTAARVAEAAAPGELLLTQRACEALCQADVIETVDRGAHALKGLPECVLHASLGLRATPVTAAA
jgi:class 3 adenylate cyclase